MASDKPIDAAGIDAIRARLKRRRMRGALTANTKARSIEFDYEGIGQRALLRLDPFFSEFVGEFELPFFAAAPDDIKFLLDAYDVLAAASLAGVLNRESERARDLVAIQERDALKAENERHRADEAGYGPKMLALVEQRDAALADNARLRVHLKETADALGEGADEGLASARIGRALLEERPRLLADNARLRTAVSALYTVTDRREHAGKMVPSIDIEEALDAAREALSSPASANVPESKVTREFEQVVGVALALGAHDRCRAEGGNPGEAYQLLLGGVRKALKDARVPTFEDAIRFVEQVSPGDESLAALVIDMRAELARVRAASETAKEGK